MMNISARAKDMLPTVAQPGFDSFLVRRQLRRVVPLPAGLKGSTCWNCASYRLTGALITETADDLDPNILCLACHHWRE